MHSTTSALATPRTYLRRYAVDKLKIDRSYVAELGLEQDAEAIIRSIVSLARSMRLKVTADGVETGIGDQRFLTTTDQALACIILMVSWVGVGYWMTFLIAGLQDIPKSLYEAATIDGATRWQKFRYVTLPQLRRPLTFVLVADTVANFLVFAPVQILTKGGPQGSTNLIMNEIYTRAFVSGDRSSAAAATVVLVLLVLVIVLIQFRLMNDKAGD